MFIYLFILKFFFTSIKLLQLYIRVYLCMKNISHTSNCIPNSLTNTSKWQKYGYLYVWRDTLHVWYCYCHWKPCVYTQTKLEHASLVLINTDYCSNSLKYVNYNNWNMLFLFDYQGQTKTTLFRISDRKISTRIENNARFEHYNILRRQIWRRVVKPINIKII